MPSKQLQIFVSRTKTTVPVCMSSSSILFTDSDCDDSNDSDDKADNCNDKHKNCASQKSVKNQRPHVKKKQKKDNNILLNRQSNNAVQLQETQNCLLQTCQYLQLGRESQTMAFSLFQTTLQEQICCTYCTPIVDVFVLSTEHAAIIACIALSCKWYGKNLAMHRELATACHQEAETWLFHCLEDRFIFSTIWTAVLQSQQANNLSAATASTVSILRPTSLFQFQQQVANVKTQKAKIVHWRNIAYIEKFLFQFHKHNLCPLARSLSDY
jgi:hypothetical protein